MLAYYLYNLVVQETKPRICSYFCINHPDVFFDI